jgi:hypothetical protein
MHERISFREPTDRASKPQTRHQRSYDTTFVYASRRKSPTSEQQRGPVRYIGLRCVRWSSRFYAPPPRRATETVGLELAVRLPEGIQPYSNVILSDCVRAETNMKGFVLLPLFSYGICTCIY